MAQITMVNIASEEYAKYLLPSSSEYNTQEAKLGGGWFLDKAMADNLVALAKATDSQLVINTAYRKPYLDVDGGSTKTKATHGIGQAVDISTYIKKGETYGAALAKGAARKLELGATVLTDDRFKGKLAFGGSIYGKSGGATKTVTPLTSNKSITIRDLNLSETMHFESEENAAIIKAMTDEELLKLNATVQAMANSRDGRTATPAKPEFTMKNADGTTYTIPAEPALDARDLRVKEFTVDTVTGAVTDIGYSDRSKLKVGSGKLKSDSAPLQNDPDILIDPDLKHTLSVTSRPGASRDKATVSDDPFTTAYGASDGKQGSMGDFMTFQGTPVKIPSRAADGTIPRVVEIDSRQFNNGIDNYRDAAQIKKITNKLVKNAMPGKHPFGAQLKHDGSPAAIKLVLDDVFKDKRTDAAKKAWEKITKSGIDYIDNFVLSRMSEVNSERYQILQSITDDYKIYFSGKSPVVTSIGGHMLNTYNQQWWYDFEYFYDNYLRGSKAVENKIRAFLTIADTIYDILILKFGVQLDANFDDSVMFSIDFVTLQKLHVGEYQTPDQRGADKNNAPKAANMSSNQTEYDDETRQLIENMTLDSESAGARGYQGTTVKNGAVDTQDLEFSLGGKGAIDSSKYNLDNIKTFNSDGSVSQEAHNTKSARDDLKNTTYADLQRQIRMGKNGFNSGTPLDNINSAANTNSREKNLSPTVNRNTGTEPFSKGSSGTGSRYDNTRRLTDAELDAAWERTASGVGTAEQQGRDLINKGKADLRDLNNQLKQPLSEFTNNFKGENKPKDAAGAIRAFGNASKSIPKLVEILGYNAGRKGQGYEEDFKNINGTIKQITRDGGAALNETGKRTEEAWKSSFEAGRRQAAADRAGRKK